MANVQRLTVKVLSGRNLNAKNPIDAYCEIAALDEKGGKLGKVQYTKVVKADGNPQWNQVLEFPGHSALSGLKVRVWDKHRLRSDKFLGQVTLKLNLNLLKTKALEDWLSVSARRSDEPVTGDVQLHIQYDDAKGPSRKERSTTVTGENIQATLKVSTDFSSPATNMKLQTSSHVVVDEDFDEDTGEDGDDGRMREGPAVACMDKMYKDSKDIAFNQQYLEISNTGSSYNLEYVRSNVKVNSGKWYYEVKLLTSGQIHMGWCTTNYDIKSNSGHFWFYDGSRQHAQKDLEQAVSYGQYWSVNDIISLSLDLQAKTTTYYRNGVNMGAAHTDVAVAASGPGRRIVPCLALSRRTKVLVNFGKEPFAYPGNAVGYNVLHCRLSEKELEALENIFIKYRDISNQEAGAGGKQESAGVQVDAKNSIYGSGLLQLQQDLGVTEEDDPLLLIFAWKSECKEQWEFNREKWMNTWTNAGCHSLDQIRVQLSEWRKELATDKVLFRSFYMFVFDYLREDKKLLSLEEALIAWKVVLKDKKWKLYTQFEDFLKLDNKKAITRDVWQQLWHFMQAHPETVKDYDTTSSWPLIFDDFVEHVQNKN